MRPYQRVVEWLAANRLALTVISRTQTPIDNVLMGLSGGRLDTMPGYPVLRLTTTGRTSGKPRTVPLLFVERSKGGWVVNDTSYGRDERPGWCANLHATPSAQIEIDGERHDVVARTATPHECAAYWKKLDDLWPPFARYRSRMRREPHIWILEPAE